MEKIKFFLLGMLVVIGLMILTGAHSSFEETPALVLPNGRYQISAWGANFGRTIGGGFGAFIVDTVSGETKIVYTSLYGINGKENVIKNNLKKSFSAME